MTYDDIAAIFLAPLDEPIPEPDVTATPARRLRDSLEPIATQGWWSRAAGEQLTELGIDEQTLVLFTSDNGPWWQGDPVEWRGRKNNISEGGLRVPFIARWPGRIPAGQVDVELEQPRSGLVRQRDPRQRGRRGVQTVAPNSIRA